MNKPASRNPSPEQQSQQQHTPTMIEINGSVNRHLTCGKAVESATQRQALPHQHVFLSHHTKVNFSDGGDNSWAAKTETTSTTITASTNPSLKPLMPRGGLLWNNS
mmetsp:Transcript_57390/g.68548  ORF Transcript_57390/g.68548 Transcript_57390/m.68548 type:complete len:106 (+) Transcript_57390:207-524(+)